MSDRVYKTLVVCLMVYIAVMASLADYNAKQANAYAQKANTNANNALFEAGQANTAAGDACSGTDQVERTLNHDLVGGSDITCP
jgi:hypothetical protein